MNLAEVEQQPKKTGNRGYKHVQHEWCLWVVLLCRMDKADRSWPVCCAVLAKILSTLPSHDSLWGSPDVGSDLWNEYEDSQRHQGSQALENCFLLVIQKGMWIDWAGEEKGECGSVTAVVWLSPPPGGDGNCCLFTLNTKVATEQRNDSTQV